LAQRRVDKERLERADRESKLTIEAEREARNAKTARLREQRISVETVTSQEAASSQPPRPQKRRGRAKKPSRKIIEID